MILAGFPRPDSHDLNCSNRPVRTRMPCGVAGALTAARYAVPRRVKVMNPIYQRYYLAPQGWHLAQLRLKPSGISPRMPVTRSVCPVIQGIDRTLLSILFQQTPRILANHTTLHWSTLPHCIRH